ncbi:dihydrofolate reductase-like [Babylonia areolata]|uniref:dihydrofolate reductase-like n=1 Tax=Babylonia areolata TaxID=304850 RepID=UPI003FD1D5FC
MADGTDIEIMTAFLDKDQGFALDDKIPWPYLKGDHEYYINHTTTRKEPSKRNVYILGKRTWGRWCEEEKCNPALFTVVTSTTMTSEGVPYLQKVLPSLDDAINYVTTPPVRDQIEKIFVLGGEQNYSECIDDPRLKRIWVTRVFGDFSANFFFPKFQHKFKRVKCDTLDESMQEDNGVRYQYELWERFAN